MAILFEVTVKAKLTRYTALGQLFSSHIIFQISRTFLTNDCNADVNEVRKVG